MQILKNPEPLYMNLGTSSTKKCPMYMYDIARLWQEIQKKVNQFNENEQKL